MHKWQSDATNGEQKARDSLSAAMWLHTTFKNHVWLWRGQADGRFGVEPGIHTRVLNSRFPHAEATSIDATAALLAAARAVELDKHHDTRLPDLALLAHLQHHGAATPLLDVSTDPLIALWMVAFADAKTPDSLDDTAGALFGILRPDPRYWIDPLDARPYVSTDQPSVSSALNDKVWWYRAPDVTERLRIQRGSFILGTLARPDERSNTTLPIELAGTSENAISNRLEKRGERSNATIGKVEIFKIVIPGASKPHLRRLLEDRSGLSIEAIYPTPWHRPFIDQFAKTYGRGRRLDLDLSPPSPGVAPAPTAPLPPPVPSH